MIFSGLRGGRPVPFGAAPVRTLLGALPVRTLLASAALVGALALGGCDPEMIEVAKHLKPLTPQMLATLEQKGMAADSPILVRLFKEESELEVWKQNRNGQFALLKTYPICRWSGELGPKIREGDRQAPEGFYNITRGQMNPNSSYYLSFDTGYPNAYDRAWGRTGAQLMVHGDCSSRGCYAMTDDQIGEIYSLARDSILGGQRAFQLQAYPFRMTAANMAKHRDSPHLAFWKMLKEGNDHFEATHQQVKVDVCEKRYVFNAETGGMSTFQPTGQCPSYQVAPEIASAVSAKTKRDAGIFAALAKRGIPTAPVRTGRDGGMNPIFVSQLRPQEVRDEKGNVRIYVENPKAAKVSSYTPSATPDPDVEVAASASPTPAASPAASVPTQVASADPDAVPMPRPAPTRAGAATSLVNRGAPAATADTGPETTGKTGAASASIFASSTENARNAAKETWDRASSSVAGVFGIGDPEAGRAEPGRTGTERSDRNTVAALPASAPIPRPRPGQPQRTAVPASAVAAHTPKPPTPKAEAPKALAAAASRPRGQQTAQALPSDASGDAKGEGKSGLVSGAAPVLPTGSFDGRWPGTGSFR